MLIFLLKYQKSIHIFSVNRVDILKWKKTHKKPKYLISNENLNFDNKFYNILQNSWI
jgi:hypothetical protein